MFEQNMLKNAQNIGKYMYALMDVNFNLKLGLERLANFSLGYSMKALLASRARLSMFSKKYAIYTTVVLAPYAGTRLPF